MNHIDAVRQAIHNAIKENPARLKGEAIAARMGTGVATSTVYRWGELGEALIPLERFVQFILITGDIRPIVALCAAVGGYFIPHRTVRGVVSGELASVRAVKEFADLLQANAQAMLDGRVTVRENARIQKEGSQAMQAIAEMLELARVSAEGPRV